MNTGTLLVRLVLMVLQGNVPAARMYVELLKVCSKPLPF